MKIICLTENGPALRYTVNQLHRQHGVSLVVLENSKSGMLFRDLKRFGVTDTLYRVRMVAKRLWPSGNETQRLNRFFGDAWRELDERIEILQTKDVNSTEVRSAIERIRPEVIVCQGTTLVGDPTIEGVPYPLNIHAGLSPRYRGSRCTEWAVARGDLRNIGPTVHRLTKNIDGGAILGQARVQVEPEDTIADIDARIVIAATRIASEAIDALKRGETLNFVPQPRDQGTVYMRRQFTRFMFMHVKELVRRGEIRKMLNDPSCPTAPMVAPWPEIQQFKHGES